MKKIIFYSFLFVISFSLESKAQNSNIQNQYTFKKGDYNGIGKWYMGRERSHWKDKRNVCYWCECCRKPLDCC